MEKTTNWGDLTRQYQRGKRNVDRYSRELKADQQSGKAKKYEEKILISSGISKEMGGTIQKLKKYHWRDCSRILDEQGEILFSERQRAVLELRSKGFTFEEIGKRLGISKVAAYKTEQRCEKKMNRMGNAEKG